MKLSDRLKKLRLVSAKRARKLRRRGIHVWYACETLRGKARYFWEMP